MMGAVTQPSSMKSGSTAWILMRSSCGTRVPKRVWLDSVTPPCRGRLRSFLGHVTGEATDLHRAAVQQARTALRQLGSRVDRLGLDDGVAADNLLGLHERSVGDDLGLEDPPFPGESVARVDHPASLHSLADPC